jgi:hypothetical protein
MIDFRDQEIAADLEKRILEEIADRERKVRELQDEIEMYRRMLLKARQQNELTRRVDVTRKNSVNRILIENAVLQSLKQTGRIRGTRSLYRDACLMVSTLKESTFRTILHRMKNRGLISSASNGKWQISPVMLSPEKAPRSRLGTSDGKDCA